MPPLHHPTGRAVSAARHHLTQLRLAITADADIVAARAAVRDLASDLALPQTDLTCVATAVSEACRNIVRFAGQGELVAELLEQPRPGIKVTVYDDGPGIEDMREAMVEGFSSSGALGLGLPGMCRLMDDFTIVSEPGHGTTITMVKWQDSRRG